MSNQETTIVERIRNAILDGDWAPGHRLAPVALAKRFDTSSTVVREALTRLTGESLVESKLNRGFFTPQINLREFQDITELRCVTDTLALSLSIERGDMQWETSLIAAHHRMIRTPRRAGPGSNEINDEWRNAHMGFHQALLAGCGCEPMLRIANNLSQSTDLYRRWAAPIVTATKRDVETEHSQLLEATLAKDVERACGLLRAHFEKTAHSLTR